MSKTENPFELFSGLTSLFDANDSSGRMMWMPGTQSVASHNCRHAYDDGN
jgi:hypothetical protein